MHIKVESGITGINDDIDKTIEKWFQEKLKIDEINDGLKELGALKAVQTEKTKTDRKIKLIEEKYKLNKTEIKRLQTLSEQGSGFEHRISEIIDELYLIGIEGKKGDYFRKSEISLTPSIRDLPDSLQEKLNEKLDKLASKTIIDTNKIVSSYYQKIEKEKKEIQEKLKIITVELKSLMKKQEKNEELESLINKSGEYKTTIDEIKSRNIKLKEPNNRLSIFQKDISGNLKKRSNLITELRKEIQDIDQSKIKDMKFGIEAEIDGKDLELIQRKVNSREKSNFVSSGILNIEKIKSNPQEFLEDIYSGKQKINQGNEKQSVASEALTLTKKILFTAEMEGDRIGGFSDATMTPGKRALFVLRLILAESEDSWPLLIDQPEDDLDSRSIFDDIVPFLREKKRDRQIIMVSHNANLVIGADSEQIIVANRHGEDRKNIDGADFNYMSGSIENTKDKDSKIEDTLKSQGIREHSCEILEGGELAFEKRSNRYDIKLEKH